MTTFLLLPHRGRPEAADLARRTVEWIEGHGHIAKVLADDAHHGGLSQWEISSIAGQKIDLAVSMGGDGTMLRALDLMCAEGVPVLGVNFGHLGYLTEVEPDNVEVALQRFLDGDYKIEERMTIDVIATSAPEGDATKSTISLLRRVAMNEVVVEKPPLGTTVRLEVEIDDRPFLTYAVDGIIVATPTGSTAYNLSARGPILSPTLEALLMTPVSPHMLFDRSLVLDKNETLKLRVLGRRDAAVVVDGQHVATISAGGVVECRRSPRPARLVTFNERDFRQILKSKFGLTDR